MKKLLFLLLMLPSLATMAQEQFATVQVPVDGQGLDLRGKKTMLLSNGTYFTVGTVRINSNDYPAYLIQNQAGATVSAAYFNGLQDIAFHDFIPRGQNGTIYLCGRNDIALDNTLYFGGIAYDGTPLFHYDYSLNAVDRFTPMKLIDDGQGIILQGAIVRDNAGVASDDLFLARFDYNGLATNMNSYCATNSCNTDEQFYSTTRWNNSYWTAGNIVETNRSVLVEYNSNLTYLNSFLGNSTYVIEDLYAHSNGNLIISGYIRNSSDFFVSSINTNRTTAWNRRFSINATGGRISQIIEDQNGNVIVSGTLAQPNNNEQSFLVKFGQNGTYVNNSAKVHDNTLRAWRKHYDLLANGNILGFNNANYDLYGASYNTIETFVYDIEDELCVFSDGTISQSSPPFTISVYTNFNTTPRSYLPVSRSGDRTNLNLIERNVCHPCHDISFTTPDLNVPANDDNTPYYMREFEKNEDDQTFEHLDAPKFESHYENQAVYTQALTADEINEVSIISMKGQLIKTKVFGNTNQIQLPAQLQPGIYLIKINDQEVNKIVVP